MERSLIFISLLAMTQSLDFKRYYYFSKEVYWTEAQAFCREHYEDLASVESQGEQKALERAAGQNSLSGFFGLHRDVNDIQGWKWSGGGNATYTNWNYVEPNNGDNMGPPEIFVMVTGSGGWNDVPATAMLPFYCMSPPGLEAAVEEEEGVRKGWEEASEHCRETNTKLISLRSETELLWIQDLMTQQGQDRIWIGLRFLAGRWLWVNADPLGFQAWSEEEQDLQCPLQKRCVALSAEGLWETLDCLEKLRFLCN